MAGLVCDDQTVLEIQGPGTVPDDVCASPQFESQDGTAKFVVDTRAFLEKTLAAMASFEETRAFRQSLAKIELRSVPDVGFVVWFGAFQRQLDPRCQRPWV